MIRICGRCTLCDIKINYARCVSLRNQSRQRNPEEITELAAGYQPREVESHVRNFDYFVPEKQTQERPFSLVLPPPNVTGTLHLGHALTATVQDVLVKWQKMRGRETVWVPGLDHAGIATQAVVEKILWKEKRLKRQDLGREKFEEEVWKWKRQKYSTITEQLRRLNLSLDWEREVFTMDERRSDAVIEAFVRLFDSGSIYRADRLVNWSCALRSTISDIEVDHVAVEGATDLTVPGYARPVRFGVLTRFAYKVDGSGDELVVATTRPETILGDVAVAVHPKDARFAPFVGKRLRHPFRNETIPVIADDFVDPEFGTGAVKLTPGHDPVDFEAAKRHGLTPMQIINEDGVLTSNCSDFAGVKRFDARSMVVDRLGQMGLLRGTEDHQMAIPVCSRSKDVVEFLIRPQWFLKCSEMAETALKSVADGRLAIEPKQFEKNWSDWLENIRDWCVSRQLWWGHRIPAYLCSAGQKQVWVAARDIKQARIKASPLLSSTADDITTVQDEDVLDTWFSSALQPFSAFGWPQEGPDFHKYYPLTVMETGHDILFFWVARMVMLGERLTGTLPFGKILLHGVVCDSDGRKMSKSLGNVVSPDDVIDGATTQKLLESIESNNALTEDEFKQAVQGQRKMFPDGIPECGADALRFTLVSHNVKSHYVGFDVAECHANRLFCNKIWQATKFAVSWCRQVAPHATHLTEPTLMDRWILSRLCLTVETVDVALQDGDLHVATAAIKNFLYYEFCDVYLECVKSILRSDDEIEAAKRACATLTTCLDAGLRLLAPFMPSLSRHLHERLPKHLLIVSVGFPDATRFVRDEPLEKQVETATEIVRAIRRLKKIFNVTAKHEPSVVLAAGTGATLPRFARAIRDLAALRSLEIVTALPSDVGDYVTDSAAGATVLLKVPSELRRALRADRSKLLTKREKVSKELEKMDKMMSGANYREKATTQAQEAHSKKVAALREQINRIDFIQQVIKSSE